MTWGQAIKHWQTWLAAGGSPATTRRLRHYQIARFAASYPGSPWRPDAASMLEWLSREDWSQETRKSHRTALRSFYGWAHANGHITTDPSILLPPVRLDQPKPRPTPETVLRNALTTAEPRARLMIILAARVGLRRGEIAVIHQTDITETVGGRQLLVHGKGGKQRVVPLADDLAAELTVWGKADVDGWVFPGRVDGHMSPQYVGLLVSRALNRPGWTAHTLRHRFATIAYQGSRDLLSVQTLLGHSSPETTRRYVQLPQDDLRAAMAHAA